MSDGYENLHRILRHTPKEGVAEEAPQSIVKKGNREISGAVKWYDHKKGYGFIIPDSHESDVLIHASALRREGVETLVEGDTVVVEIRERDRGVQVTRLVSFVAMGGGSTSGSPSGAHNTPRRIGPFEQVTVRWFNRARGFGFLTRGQGTEDIFVHMETMRRCGFFDPCGGDVLWARFGAGPHGLVASELQAEDVQRRSAV